MLPTLIIHTNLYHRLQKIQEELAKFKFTKNHPDVLWFEEGSKLGVEQAKQIREFLGLKPYQSDIHALVILSADNLTHDAQNALLKTLEDPPSQSLILLGASKEEDLLPTILSRCQLLLLEPENLTANGEFTADIETLLSQDIESRFSYVEKLEDKEGFLMALSNYFRNTLHSDDNARFFLKYIIEAQKYYSQNVNIRAVLEYLMLKMPVIRK